MEKKIEEVTTKKVLRGIKSARGTTRLKFSHEQAKQNGLFLAHLDDVTVTNMQISEDKTGMPSFNGLEVPKITFTFSSNEEEVAKRHYTFLSFNAVESNVNTIPGGKEEWKVNSVFDWIKHILNVYVLKGRELTDEEAEALSLTYEDFDEQGEYVPVEPETVVASWRVLFDNVANILNHGNNDNPYYKTKDNKNIPVWIKLLRYVKTAKKGWTPLNNGDLVFPSFVGEGCIEIYKQNTTASIHINSVRESIIPMNIEKPKAPNMPIGGISSALGIASTPVIDPMSSGSSYGDINNEAMDDVPF